MCTFTDRYLLSGALNGRVYIWNGLISLPTAQSSDPTDPTSLPIENRYPLYELQFEEKEDISLVAADTGSMSLYNTSDTQLVYKWNMRPSPYTADRRSGGVRVGDVIQFNELGFEHGFGWLPKVAKFAPENLERQHAGVACERTISLKRTEPSFVQQRLPMKRTATSTPGTSSSSQVRDLR